MTFIDKTLSDNEAVVGQYSLHWVNYIAIVRMLMIATALFIIIKSGALAPFTTQLSQDIFNMLLVVAYGYLLLRIMFIGLTLRFTELAATSKRVICKTGIWSRNTSEMKISSIETVTLHQSVVGRLLNYGSLLVTGKGVSDVVFKDISDPVDVKGVLRLFRLKKTLSATALVLTGL